MKVDGGDEISKSTEISKIKSSNASDRLIFGDGNNSIGKRLANLNLIRRLRTRAFRRFIFSLFFSAAKLDAFD